MGELVRGRVNGSGSRRDLFLREKGGRRVFDGESRRGDFSLCSCFLIKLNHRAMDDREESYVDPYGSRIETEKGANL